MWILGYYSNMNCLVVDSMETYLDGTGYNTYGTGNQYPRLKKPASIQKWDFQDTKLCIPVGY
jgi:hypothetical protein